MAQLLNTAAVSGEYQGVTVTDTTQLIVELSALSISKRADKQIWHENDELTYTIEVRNVDEADPGESVTGVVFTDTIDPAIAALIINSVTVDGDPKVIDVDFTYNTTTGLLTINPLGDIAPRATVVISFRVTKVQP